MLLLLACAPRPPIEVLAAGLACAPAPTHFVLAGGTVVGVGVVDVEVADGRIVSVGPPAAEGSTNGATRVDVTGRFLVPAAIDSHVHLAYFPEGEALAAGGVAGAVDLAAPPAFLAHDHAPLRVIAAGPMVTAPGGYPTQGWGRDGYGLECADAAEAEAAVDALHAQGAGLIKLPVTGVPGVDADVLGVEALAAATARAHVLELPVASHALGDAEAAAAAVAGVDVLAHTPVEALSAATIDAWRGGAVISTLSAFGGTYATVANLRALREAGAVVLYGTDFGNTRTTGVDPVELALLAEAGLTPAEILAALTSVPASFWGFEDLGAIAVGKAASVLVLPTDPLLDAGVLAAPTTVYIDGVRRAG